MLSNRGVTVILILI